MIKIEIDGKSTEVTGDKWPALREALDKVFEGLAAAELLMSPISEPSAYRLVRPLGTRLKAPPQRPEDKTIAQHAADALKTLGEWSKTRTVVETMIQNGWKTTATSNASLYGTVRNAMNDKPMSFQRNGDYWGLVDWPVLDGYFIASTDDDDEEEEEEEEPLLSDPFAP